MLGVSEPGFWRCHVAAGTFALRITRNSTSTPYNKRAHVKEDMDSGMYIHVIRIHS